MLWYTLKCGADDVPTLGRKPAKLGDISHLDKTKPCPPIRTVMSLTECKRARPLRMTTAL